MIGTNQPSILRGFYEKVLAKKPDMIEGNWAGWSVGNCFLSVGEHSEVKGKTRESERILFNFETDDVKGEFKRIAELGAEVVKEPYEMGESWIATFADPDGNYFQLMTPWKS
jgi:predicted enzyme related to lactoylglutathione lyase